MKVSDWIREYQVTGEVPEIETERKTEMSFWVGWLMGCSTIATCMDERRAMAIKAAEFIESQV